MVRWLVHLAAGITGRDIDSLRELPTTLIEACGTVWYDYSRSSATTSIFSRCSMLRSLLAASNATRARSHRPGLEPAGQQRRGTRPVIDRLALIGMALEEVREVDAVTPSAQVGAMIVNGLRRPLWR